MGYFSHNLNITKMKNITIKSIRDKQKQTEEVAEKFFSKPKDDINVEDLGEKCKCNKCHCFLKFILLTAFTFIVGGIGGVTADRFALPYIIAKYPELKKYDFIKNINEGTTIVRVTENVNISQDKSIVESIKKVSPSIVRILKNEDPKKSQYEYVSNGIILTSNGYIVTSSKIFADNPVTTSSVSDKDKKDVIKAEAREILYKVKLSDGRTFDAKLINKDPVSGLAMIKIEENNLPVIPLANSDILELGERLILIDDSIAIDIVSKFINDYISPLDKNDNPRIQKRVMIMRELGDSYNGATVINIKGEIVGISEGGDLIIPTNELNNFIKSVIK